MEAVGSAVLDPERRPIFGIACFHGLLEAIGLQHVAAWVELNGQEYLRWLARHFESPRLDEAQQVSIPSLTQWLFQEHEADDNAFQWFLMGRHSGTVWTSGEVDPTRKRREMEPFLGHQLRRVREWALYEIREEERFAQHFAEMDEEVERL
jgi:hypothetical protein